MSSEHFGGIPPLILKSNGSQAPPYPRVFPYWVAMAALIIDLTVGF